MVLPLLSSHVDSATDDRDKCKEGNGSVTGLGNIIMKLCQAYLARLKISPNSIFYLTGRRQPVEDGYNTPPPILDGLA